MSKSPAANGDASRAPLPQSLRAALPAAIDLVKLSDQIAGLVPQLDRELKKSKKSGALALARAYVVIYRAAKKLEEDLKPFEALLKQYKEVEVPAVFEQEGVPNVSLAEGFRVGVSYTTRASIRDGMKDKAYDWLCRSGHADIITSTVNSSTLSSMARELMEEQNVELPASLFNVAQMPNTSVTATK